ncbi:hypothetical protein [Ignicoccus hospitalis]|uniref:Major facilitator superfamily MFS_1 n=1 Tax=Ignicoccus hospitalis (strain KIN4/I / DSM 18386 / JCM 14125) TaxID=453591 RepID=A8AB89_IGNH4|nr:hypothetical protein [Ignicoccus hospitalis]ABU82191.1 hypothetical protein Igni_1012 [Ignicoccus hospitalis KIN4/I]HIH91149.1 MFS transporter [Desulfurococcaceae archaeon]
MREEAAAFLLTFAAASAFVALPYLLLQAKGIPLGERVPADRIVIELGTINTAFMLSRALGSSRASEGSPKVGALLVASGLALMTLPSFPSLLLGRALQGVGSGLAFPALERGAARRGVKGMVRLTVAQNLGFSTGSLFAGAVMVTPSLPLAIALPAAAAASTLVPSGARGRRKGGSNKVLKILYLTAFINGLSLGSRGPALSAYVMQYVSALPAHYSAAWGVPGLLSMALSYALASKLDSLGTASKLYASSVLKLVQVLALALVPFVADLWSLLALLTLGRTASTLSVSASKAAQGSVSGKVEHFGNRQTAFSLGNALGPLVGASLYKALGPASLFAVAGLGLLSSALYALGGKEAKKLGA